VAHGTLTNKFLANVKELRSDLSDWLIHFTQGTDEQAAETLEKILAPLSEILLHCMPKEKVAMKTPLGSMKDKLY
jgi:hypothetical protein